MKTPKLIAVLAAVLLSCAVSFTVVQVEKVQTSLESQQYLQTQAVPSLRYLEQMRFGITRVVASTSELIVVHIPTLVNLELESPYSPEGEEMLIEEGFEIFESAYSKLKRIVEDTPESGVLVLDRETLALLYENYTELKTSSYEIVSRVNAGAPIEEILELKEAFEESEEENLEAVLVALNNDQLQTDMAFQAQADQLVLLERFITTLGFSIALMILIFAGYALKGVRIETLARLSAEKLAKANEAEVKRRKAIEASLASHQKLEALGTMLGGIAHSVNNYLMPIMVLSKMVQKELPEESEVQEDLQRIYTSAEHASVVLKDVMAFSRGDELSDKRCEIVTCVTRALNITKAATPSTIEVVADITAPKSWVAAQGADIETLLLNLASNASDAMEKTTGTLSIRLERVVLNEEEVLARGISVVPGLMVHLSISDTGKGIDEKYLSRIFDPFFTTKEVGKGSGLGLSVTHATVKQAGGDIQVSSEQGIGTRFDIYLPVMEEYSGQA